jgi:hypothetical protein
MADKTNCDKFDLFRRFLVILKLILVLILLAIKIIKEFLDLEL